MYNKVLQIAKNVDVLTSHNDKAQTMSIKIKLLEGNFGVLRADFDFLNNEYSFKININKRDNVWNDPQFNDMSIWDKPQHYDSFKKVILGIEANIGNADWMTGGIISRSNAYDFINEIVKKNFCNS